MNHQTKNWLVWLGSGLLGILILLVCIQFFGWLFGWLFGQSQGWANILVIAILSGLAYGALRFLNEVFEGRIHLFHGLAFLYALIMTGIGIYALIRQVNGHSMIVPETASPSVKVILELLLQNPISALSLIFSGLFLGLLSEVVGGLHYHFRKLEDITNKSR